MKLRNMLCAIVALLFLTPTLASAQKLKGKDQLVTISTPQGEIKLVLFEDTPKHKENFLKLAKEGFYDGTTFHRIIDGFMIQGGDPNSKDDNPNNDGSGNPGYTIPAEINPIHKHVRGAVAAARMGDQVNPMKESSGSQFYIVENHDGTPMLDEAYTVFGQVVDGLDVIDKIAEQPKNQRDRPLTDIKMKVTVESVKKKKIAKKYKYNYNQPSA
jgi:cyclophilin family peptidyl-prolyl cis-trans isomerase